MIHAKSSDKLQEWFVTVVLTDWTNLISLNVTGLPDGTVLLRSTTHQHRFKVVSFWTLEKRTGPVNMKGQHEQASFCVQESRKKSEVKALEELKCGAASINMKDRTRLLQLCRDQLNGDRSHDQRL